MPLEAAIRVNPTLQLTNGLPYDVLGWALVPFGKDASLYPHGNKLAGHPPTPIPLNTRLVAGAAGAEPPVQKAAAEGGVGVAAAQRVSSSIGSSALQDLAQNGGEGKLAGMQQVWGARSKKEAAVALAKVVAGKDQYCCRLSEACCVTGVIDLMLLFV
jgi:hypothetical protein